MAHLIGYLKPYRGLKKNLKKGIVNSVPSQLMLCTDTGELYVSNGPDKKPIRLGRIPYKEFALVRQD